MATPAVIANLKKNDFVFTVGIYIIKKEILPEKKKKNIFHFIIDPISKGSWGTKKMKVISLHKNGRKSTTYRHCP